MSIAEESAADHIGSTRNGNIVDEYSSYNEIKPKNEYRMTRSNLIRSSIGVSGKYQKASNRTSNNFNRCTLLKDAFKFFARKENSFTGESSDYSSQKSMDAVLFQQAVDEHQGSRIYKKKARDIGNKKPVSTEKGEKDISVKNLKGVFVDYITNSIFSKDPSPVISRKRTTS